MTDEARARAFAEHYTTSAVWRCVVAPIDAFRAAMAGELIAHGCEPAAAWFAVDVAELDAEKFGRGLYQGLTVRSFGSWRVGVYLR